MGVNDLWKILQPIAKPVSLEDLCNQTLVIDLSIWICENSTFKCGPTVVKPHLRNLFFRSKTLLEIGCKLIFVSDGDVISLKLDTMEKRNNNRFGNKKPAAENNEFACSQSSSQLSLSKPIKRSHFNSVVNECCELLEYMGIAVIRSPCGEAEKACAYLNSVGRCDAVISEDSDVFLYGAKVVYRNFCTDKKKNENSILMYKMDDILNELHFNRHMLVALGILIGCDYDKKGVAGVGREQTCRFFNEIYDLEQKQEIEIDVIDLMRKWSDPDYQGIGSTTEDKIRKLAIDQNKDKIFPNEKIIREFLFLKIEDKQILCENFDSNNEWKRPCLYQLQKFMEKKVLWELDYTAEKVVPLIVFYEYNKNDRSIEALHIEKKRKQAFLEYYEVKWAKMCGRNKWNDMDLGELNEYTTLERPDTFEIYYPKLVEDFQEKCSKKKSSKSKNSKNKAGDIVPDEVFATSVDSNEDNVDQLTDLCEKNFKITESSQSHQEHVSRIKKSIFKKKTRKDKNNKKNEDNAGPSGEYLANNGSNQVEDACTQQKKSIFKAKPPKKDKNSSKKRENEFVTKVVSNYHDVDEMVNLCENNFKILEIAQVKTDFHKEIDFREHQDDTTQSKKSIFKTKPPKKDKNSKKKIENEFSANVELDDHEDVQICENNYKIPERAQTKTDFQKEMYLGEDTTHSKNSILTTESPKKATNKYKNESLDDTDVIVEDSYTETSSNSKQDVELNFILDRLCKIEINSIKKASEDEYKANDAAYVETQTNEMFNKESTKSIKESDSNAKCTNEKQVLDDTFDALCIIETISNRKSSKLKTKAKSVPNIYASDDHETKIYDKIERIDKHSKQINVHSSDIRLESKLKNACVSLDDTFDALNKINSTKNASEMETKAKQISNSTIIITDDDDDDTDEICNQESEKITKQSNVKKQYDTTFDESLVDALCKMEINCVTKASNPQVSGSYSSNSSKFKLNYDPSNNDKKSSNESKTNKENAIKPAKSAEKQQPEQTNDSPLPFALRMKRIFEQAAKFD